MKKFKAILALLLAMALLVALLPKTAVIPLRQTTERSSTSSSI